MRITKMLLFAVSFLTAFSMHSASSDIFQAIARGNQKSVKTWIKSKPDLLIFNDQGQTVLHAAVMTGNCSIVKMLVKAGVGLNVLDKTGKTALDYSVEFGHVKITYDLVKKKGLIARAYNEQPLKKLIVKRMTRLYKIFIPIFILGVVLVIMGVVLFHLKSGYAAYGGVFLGIPGVIYGAIGMFEIVGLGAVTAIRANRSYLMK